MGAQDRHGLPSEQAFPDVTRYSEPGCQMDHHPPRAPRTYVRVDATGPPSFAIAIALLSHLSLAAIFTPPCAVCSDRREHKGPIGSLPILITVF